jgi:hypothetical protein
MLLKRKQANKKSKRVNKTIEFQKHLISLFFPQFSPFSYGDKNGEYHKIWWRIMRESGFHKKYKRKSEIKEIS